MANNRTAIRQAVSAVLSSAIDEATVIHSRSTGISQSEELPAISIITPNEDVTPEALNRSRYIRKLELRIEVRVAASSSTDDELDGYMAQVEDAIQNNSTFNGSVLDSVLLSSETDVGYEGNQEIGLGALVYECTYIA